MKGKPVTKLTACRLGSTAVEFGLLSPVLFLLLFGALEFGRMIWTQAGLHFAVEEAARCASVGSSACDTPAEVATFAASRITELNVAASAFTVTTPACGHQVSATYTYVFIASGLFPLTPVLSAKACFT